MPVSASCDGQPGAVPGFDQVFAAAGVDAAGDPGRWGGPAAHHGAFRPGQRGDAADPVEFVIVEAAEHDHAVAGGHAAGFGPVGLGGQRLEVLQGVGDLDGDLAAVPAQAGDPIGAFHQPRRHPQRLPQLVLDAHDVAAPPERRGAVDQRGGPGPRAQHRRGHELVVVVVERGDIQRQRRGVQVRGHRWTRGRTGRGWHPAHSRPERVEQVAGAAPVLGGGVAGGHRQQVGGGVGEDAHDVGDQRLPGGVGVDDEVERDAEQAALGHVDVGAAHDHHQRLEQRQPAGADRLGQPMPLGAAGVGAGRAAAGRRRGG